MATTDTGATTKEDHYQRTKRGSKPKILRTKLISDTALLILALEEVLGGKTHFNIQVCSNAYSISSTTDQEIDMVRFSLPLLHSLISFFVFIHHSPAYPTIARCRLSLPKDQI